MSAAGGHRPDGNDWVAAMRAQEFAKAWAIADCNLSALQERGPAKHEGPRHLQKIWRGEDLADRTVLVRCYHGLGDTIQFARFLPALARIARDVVVWCQPPLCGLIGRVPGVRRVLPLHDGVPDVTFDVDIEIMELAHALRADRSDVGMTAPYLAPAGPPVALPARQGIAVGLVWRVGNWDKRRELPASLVRTLVSPGVAAFSLQPDLPAAELAEIGARDVSSSDIDVLANTLRALDLVITVDTMVAHLAGALGCETWIMLHADCDWRWPAGACRTYWYPRARLFHQQSPGDWAGVVAEVGQSLRDRVAAISSAPRIQAENLRPAAPWRATPASAAGAASDSPDESRLAGSARPNR
ncbi:conserved protein; putative TPR repeat protein [Bradyrhizobium sp. ORS 285]|nr:conserved hypothetical protein [Bradyrhizobium sp. ORS 285]SMX60011.1 conserved protein; putative TPR repeat protein [Bradyrhizobium sp. ORS 285]